MEVKQNPEDPRYYFECPLRKGRPRIAVTVCHKQKCIFLESEAGKLRCGYIAGNRPKVNKVERGGID